VQHSHDVVSVSDAKGRCVYVSPSVEPLLGYTPDFAFFNDLSFIHPDDHQALVDTHHQVMSGPGATAVVEYRMRAADGSWRTIESRVANRLDDPVVHGLVANSRDVTATRAAENALRRSEDRLQALLQQSTDFVMVWDANDTITYFTPSVYRFIGDRIREQESGELAIRIPRTATGSWRRSRVCARRSARSRRSGSGAAVSTVSTAGSRRRCATCSRTTTFAASC